MSSLCASRLGRLPTELLIMVATYFASINLSALIRTCRYMTAQLTQTLYQEDIKSGKFYALWWSCNNGRISTLRLTLAFGANVNYIFKAPTQPMAGLDERTPLFFALMCGQLDVARLLLDRGADATIPSRGSTLILWTIQQYETPVSPERSEELHDLVRTLIEKGASPHHTNYSIYPLARAVLVNNAPLKIMELLLSYDADATGTTSPSRLDRIWELGSPGVSGLNENQARLAHQKFRLLLQHSKVNLLVDHTGDTILHALVESIDGKYPYNNRASYVEILLEEGVDVNMRSPTRGDTILERLAGCMQQHIDYKISPTWRPTTQFARRDAFRVTQTMFIRMLKAGARWNVPHDVNSAFPAEENVLLRLAKFEWAADEAISALLQHGADPDVVDEDGRGPLHLACMEINPKIAVVKTLLRFNVDPNRRDRKGQTALHALLGSPGNMESRTQICKLLVCYGVDADARDDDGLTADDIGRKWFQKLSQELFWHF